MSSSSETMFKHFIAIGALSAMVATILGAFAAHGLKAQLSDYQMHIFQTGVFYQFTHSLTLLFVGVILWHINNRLIRISGWLFFIGILLFSGSLYLMSVLNVKAIGIVTPIGGTCFIFGWILLVLGIYKTNA
ncbi:DUF423 domain-containing protein [Fluoribacter gormanii]|uniref:Protein of uncharacterized function (DUF423) n=1 Tax=Fluoribacter gormanii TaxID=464 RepID=A0A377GHT4_9GAMM|nr:DUF423 domain-containing protein [Fluoribacter gormanii]KTD01301.1 hypothetical protein Lgor_2367 [Fluoribacter gormanii]MCW8444128.1 DUF423 domain-containing protein [Fluoribacter gormanii]SIR81293.1 Uncharacterized membrane protein YgdD, TMEM256/DUF423 family [Fluoribacter gormanii]STO24308.1 Protein of uncharacterised function (DUF423) [Fluoribacter gormanii]